MVADELREAYRGLDDAIRRVVEVLGEDDSIVVEWIVCFASQRIKDGTSLTLTDFVVDPDNDAPYYRLMGLVEHINLQLRKQALEGEEE